MQRQTFKVTSTAGQVVLKHAWNAARRAVEAIMREHAAKRGATYWRGAKSYLKMGGEHVRGKECWYNENEPSDQITFTIERL